MQSEKLRALFLASIMVLSVIAIGTAPTAAQADGEINIVFEPVDAEADTNEEVTYDVNIEGADDDISAYDFTVEVDDTNIAEITDGELVEFGGQFGSVNIADDGSSVQFEEAVGAEEASGEDFTIATVTLTTGDDEGDAELSIAGDAQVDGDDGTYTNAELGTATLTVAEDDNGNGNGDDGADDDDETLERVDADRDPFTSPEDTFGAAIWQGQVIVVDDVAADAGVTIQLRERIDDSTTRLRDELITRETDGGTVYVVFDTEDRTEGDYFLRGGNAQADGTDISNTFEINVQSLTAEFDADQVTDEGLESDTDFEFDSNRATYDVEVHAEDDLDDEELFDIFTRSGAFDAGNVDQVEDSLTDDDYDGIIIRDVEDFDEYQLNFTDIDAGEYEFFFDVEDSTAADTDTITVVEEDQDGEFSQGIYTSAAGDVVEFEIELEDTDETYIQIGDQESDFLDVVYIEADDADEPVSFQVNTRTLGSSNDIDIVYHEGDNVEVLESAIDQEFNGAEDAEVDFNNDGVFYSEDREDTRTFAEYLDELDIIDTNNGENGTHQLTRPMQPTDYELYAGVEGDDGVFIVNSDDETEADNELDNAALELTANGPDEITTWVAPSDDADEDDTKEDLLEAVTERSDIAIDDRVIVQYEATGLYGAMVAASEDGFDVLEDGSSADLLAEFHGDGAVSSDDVTFTFESEDAIGNQDPTQLAFTRLDDESEGFLIIDNDEGEFFLIVDSSNDDLFRNGAPEDGATYDVELEYGTNDDERAKFPRLGEDDELAGSGAGDSFSLSPSGFPYFAADSDQSISTEIEFQDRAIAFDNLNADREVQAENVEDSEISGTTNIAPGTRAEIRVRSTDASSSFRFGQRVDIESDGDVAAEFDFADQEAGDEFQTRFRASASNVDRVNSVIVEEGSLGVADPVEDDDEEPADDDEEPVDDDEDVVDDDDDEEEPTDDETPGFGALVALVALIGAALLAARRQN